MDTIDSEVLLIHGWTCRSDDWTGTIDALKDHFRISALDLPGHGESSTADFDDWTISGMAKAVVGAVTEIATQPVILVGHSMGGAVALEAARRLDRVSGVVLVDTFVIPYGDLGEEQAREIEQPFYTDFASAIGGLVDNFTGAGASDIRKQQMKADMASNNPEAMLPLWSDLLRWSPDAAFSSLQVPVVAINGDMIPEPARQRCRPHLHEYHLEGAGHFPQFEMPDQFHNTLLRALREIN